MLCAKKEPGQNDATENQTVVQMALCNMTTESGSKETTHLFVATN